MLELLSQTLHCSKVLFTTLFVFEKYTKNVLGAVDISGFFFILVLWTGIIAMCFTVKIVFGLELNPCLYNSNFHISCHKLNANKLRTPYGVMNICLVSKIFQQCFIWKLDLVPII